MTERRLFTIALATLLPTVAFAQGTITHGDVSFVRPTGAFDSNPGADLKGASSTLTQDHLFEFGWWLRVGGDTAEQPFPVPTSQNYTGATSTLDWSTLGTGGVLSADEVATVLDPGLPGTGDGGEVEVALTIENISASPVTVTLFAIADLDLAGTFSGDSAQIFLAPRFLTLSDGATDVRAQLYGAFADAHLVRPFGGTDIKAVLNDASVTNFDSTGLPFGPGDFTGGFQWTFTLQPAESKEVAVVIGIDHSLFCDAGGGRSLFCGDFEARPPIGWSEIQPANCSGLCGSALPTAAGCYCDPLCVTTGDCCVDACLTCGRCQPF